MRPEWDEWLSILASDAPSNERAALANKLEGAFAAARVEALEEAATAIEALRGGDSGGDPWDDGWIAAIHEAAAAIRGLKG